MKKTNRRPTAFVLVSTNHGSMLVNRHDYRTIEQGSYGVGYQLLNAAAFDQEEVDLALQLLETRKQHFGDGVVAIDCGANIGVHTLEWAQFMHGWGQVIAIEAQERIFYALAGNITLNNCFNAKAIFAAVGRDAGTIRVPQPDYFTPSSFGSLEIRKTEHTEFIGQEIDYSDDNTSEIRLMSIDELKLDRLDFIKIDIEGMETDTLYGAEKSIATFKPQMLIERIKSNEQEIRNFLTDHGYAIFEFGINLVAVHTTDPASERIHPPQQNN